MIDKNNLEFNAFKIHHTQFYSATKFVHKRMKLENKQTLVEVCIQTICLLTNNINIIRSENENFISRIF